MRIEITGRNYEVNDRIRELINTKLPKLTKYFSDIIEARCVLKNEKYRNICEIMVVGNSYDITSEQEADTMEDAVNSTFDHLKRQAQKSHTKSRDKKHGKKKSPDNWTVQVFEPATVRSEPDSRPRIIKTTNLPIRPMSVEQAAMMLDESKHEFIVFRDLDTDKVTVIYKRQDNNFGMIAPEF